MATFDQLEIIAIDNLIHVNVIKTESESDIVYIEDLNEYKFYLNEEGFNDKVFWTCLVKFFVFMLCRNAFSRESIETMIERRHHGERLMDRVSVLQHTVISLNNILGSTYKYRLEDWLRDSDKTYTFKREEAFEEKTFYNKQQSNLISYKINSNMNLWNDAGWKGCAFIRSETLQRPIIFGLAFKNISRGKIIVAEWKSDTKVKIYIVKGIDASHPTWYRVCIVPIIPSESQESNCYYASMCRKHTMTPPTHDSLNMLEILYHDFGGCWLMPVHINEDDTLDMPSSFDEAYKFTNLEFREAYQISITDPAREALEPDDNPFIPAASKETAPVLKVLNEMKDIMQNK